MSESGTSHRKFMAIAIEEAKKALEEGEVPVGACIVMEQEVIARAHNMREGYSDSTAHAEMLVIREASFRLGRWRLSDCTLYVTLEPCAMCAGAIVQARLGTLVFGAFDDKAGAVGSLYDIPRDFRLNHFVEVIPGIMSEETSELMKGFFTGKR
ncbi:MAG TPA: tRNA adenosine(34) deaminase TadA [Bacillota bacterium]|nr:tRNA adenosine(34) deaminase TadA [Bacillota bacterium]HOH10073.1 tRNA adenosine(34) deaminase TadA [Bacillota bacterium]HOS50144.1 tRNA adenosine(34) deaminase TadA [Bacillota bacterium]HOY89608.1 tRNA adenosine(34) deaminase TadA [Bacillota bacterium]HPI01425.1 tRNA adenosine(34) deaminase TadA [Bacillota bacterium]